MSTLALPFPEAAPSGIAGLDPRAWVGLMNPGTAQGYAFDVAQFRAWLAARGGSMNDVTSGLVTVYLAELASGAVTGRPCGKGTQARKLAAIRSFYRFARAEGATTIDPTPFTTPKPRRDNADPGGIDPLQAHAVWDATAGHPRRRALVAVLLFCGLRVSEAVSLQVADLQEQQGARVLRVMGKGERPRTAVLPAVAVVAITEWLAVRGDQDGPLFCTRTGKAMDRRAAYGEITKLGAKVGVPGLHPHTLRHTFATSAVDSGVEVLRLATALGHTSPTTTMRYIRGRDVVTGSPVHAVADAILSAQAKP